MTDTNEAPAEAAAPQPGQPMPAMQGYPGMPPGMMPAGMQGMPPGMMQMQMPPGSHPEIGQHLPQDAAHQNQNDTQYVVVQQPVVQPVQIIDKIIEIPQIQTVQKFVTKIEEQIVIKEVPKVTIQTVERIVEVPQIEIQ